eukprot:SAG25_NODE_1156_length_3756_cov_3.235986_7_plen_108_part_00
MDASDKVATIDTYNSSPNTPPSQVAVQYYVPYVPTADKWRWMQKSFIWLRRRFPRQRDVVSKDGDAIRPIERISDGEYSRIRCNKELANYVMPRVITKSGGVACTRA